jgi:hypothetical protein
MARLAFAFAALFLAPSQISADDKLACAIDGAAAADDALNAAVFIFAATQRCKGDDAASADKVKCTVDITSTIAAVSKMATTIAKAVENCGTIKDENADCGIAAADFVSATSLLTAKAAGSTRACSHIPHETPLTTPLGNCAIDVSGTVHGIFNSANSLKGAKEDCDDEKECATNALSVMSALSAMGGAIAGSVNDCSIADGADANVDAACAANILGAFAALNDVARTAVLVSSECAVADSRLFEMQGAVSTKSGASWSVVALFSMGALVIGLAGGMRYKRNTHAYAEAEKLELSKESSRGIVGI